MFSTIMLYFVSYFVCFMLLGMLHDLIHGNKFEHLFNFGMSTVLALGFLVINAVSGVFDEQKCDPSTDKVLVEHNGVCYIKLSEGYVPSSTIIKKSLED